VLAEVDDIHTELEEISGLLSGELSIGGVYPTGPYDLFALMADFRTAHPGVTIHMVEGTQDDVLEAMRADELDCAFAAIDPDTLGDEFAATLLWEDELVVAMAPGHDLCAKGEITFEELAAEDLIAYRDNSAMRRRLERTMGARGGDDPPVGRRGAGRPDRAAPDRAEATYLADRPSLARGPSPGPGRQGIHRPRAQARQGGGRG
jgi:DNA-binding transcriptional LysR family regulator